MCGNPFPSNPSCPCLSCLPLVPSSFLCFVFRSLICLCSACLPEYSTTTPEGTVYTAILWLMVLSGGILSSMVLISCWRVLFSGFLPLCSFSLPYIAFACTMSLPRSIPCLSPVLFSFPSYLLFFSASFPCSEPASFTWSLLWGILSEQSSLHCTCHVFALSMHKAPTHSLHM